MNCVKFTALVFFCLLFLQTAGVAQSPTPEAKRDDVPAEILKKASEALIELKRETAQLNLPENRVRAQIHVAELMWRQDEREARLIFDAAFTELQTMFVAANPPEGEELNTIEKSKMYETRYRLSELRSELILAMAAVDSKTALKMLAGLKVRLLEEYDPLKSDELELEITQAIAKDDPDQSYTVAKKQLDANGVSYQFVETLRNLHKRDPKLGAKLGQDILARIKAAKIRVAKENDTSPTTKKDGEIDFWEVIVFVNAASQLNRLASADKAKKMLPLLSDSEMRDLVGLLANSFLAEAAASPYSISQALPEIVRYTPALAQRIRRKIGETASAQLDKISENSAFYDQLTEKSADELAQLADVSAADVRDSRYAFAVAKALESDDPEKAQAIASRIKDRKVYDYLFEQIDSAMPLAKARRGDLAEVRKMLASLRTDQERIATLTELASTFAANGEKEAAKTLLDESRQMMSSYLKRHTDLATIVKVSGVYAVASPADAFLLVESTIAQMGDIINASIKISEYYDDGLIESNELHFSAMSRQLLINVPKSPTLMKNLAIADFDRAIRLADGFQRPEMRIFVRLRIIESILDKDALEKEQERYNSIANEEDGH